jgi:hypothetical protein
MTPRNPRRVPRLKRNRRFTTHGNRSSVMIVRLENFYDFRNWKDVIRYKTRLRDGLHSIGSTRLPRATLIRRVSPGRMN